jgi:hypothetical protein
MIDWNEAKNYLTSDEIARRIPEGSEVIPVVGVTFVPEYPNNILRLVMLSSSPTYVQLVRNPNNAYDSNAVEVRYQDAMLGHVSKDVAARIAPIMDQGDSYLASVFQVRVSPENPKNPGLDILLVRGE